MRTPRTRKLTRNAKFFLSVYILLKNCGAVQQICIFVQRAVTILHCTIPEHDSNISHLSDIVSYKLHKYCSSYKATPYFAILLQFLCSCQTYIIKGVLRTAASDIWRHHIQRQYCIVVFFLHFMWNIKRQWRETVFPLEVGGNWANPEDPFSSNTMTRVIDNV